MKRLFAIILLSSTAIALGDDLLRFPPPAQVDTQMIAAVQTGLESIIVPHFSVTNMPLNDVVNLLVKSTEESGYPCSLVLNLSPIPGNTAPIPEYFITMDLRDIQYTDLLDAVCRQTGLMWRLTPIPIISSREHFEHWEKNNSVQQGGPGYPSQGAGSPDP